MLQASTAAGGVPGDGDDVEFSRLLRRRSGAVWAVDMALTCRAAERRELGQVGPQLVLLLLSIHPLAPHLCQIEEVLCEDEQTLL